MMKSDKELTTVFFTIVAKNYISYARTLCESIAKHHPDAKVYICLSDRLSEELEINNEKYELIEADDLDILNYDSFAFRYDVMEFSTAIKPQMFRWIFNHTNAKKVIYLDPDILVVSPLVQVLDLLDQGASAVLTPHLLSRIDDTYLPNENTMLQVGVYNLGFIALSRQEEAHKLVTWWCDRLEKGAIVDLANGLFTDQKWADLMPCLFGGVAVLRDTGYNAAYWNLMHRQIRNVEGQWLANDKALAFFHFSGVNPNQPTVFSKHQDRYMLSDVGQLKSLYEYYLERLKVNGYFETKNLPYVFNYLDEGTKIHAAMRSYFRSNLDNPKSDVKNPFALSPAYFNQSESKYGKKSPVTRFMAGLLQQSSELQKSFDLNSLSGQYAYASWFVHSASNVYGVDERYIQPVAEILAGWASDSPDSLGLMSSFKNKVYIIGYGFYRKYPALARKLIRLLPESLRYRIKSATKNNIYSPITKSLINSEGHYGLQISDNVDIEKKKK